MEKLFEPRKKKKINEFLKNINFQLLSHIKSDLCWFNFIYTRKRCDIKMSIFNFIWNRHDIIRRNN